MAAKTARLALKDAAEKKFNKLRDEWKAKRGHEPSTMKIIVIPAYQKIIGMGPDAIPFLLRELENDLDNWFWALMMITDQDPVPEELRGHGAEMARLDSMGQRARLRVVTMAEELYDADFPNLSKLASDEDIRHSLAGLEGPAYGIVIGFLKRPRKA